jgi:hypothetical protein
MAQRGHSAGVGWRVGSGDVSGGEGEGGDEEGDEGRGEEHVETLWCGRDLWKDKGRSKLWIGLYFVVVW